MKSQNVAIRNTAFVCNDEWNTKTIHCTLFFFCISGAFFLFFSIAIHRFSSYIFFFMSLCFLFTQISFAKLFTSRVYKPSTTRQIKKGKWRKWEKRWGTKINKISSTFQEMDSHKCDWKTQTFLLLVTFFSIKIKM